METIRFYIALSVAIFLVALFCLVACVAVLFIKDLGHDDSQF